MANALELTILTPQRKVLEKETVGSISLTGSEGKIQILPGHAAMVGTLEVGTFECDTPSKGKLFGVISSGFFEVEGDSVVLVAETLELQNEIDVARAKAAQQKAQEMLKEAGLTDEKFRKYELKLQRAMIRQQSSQIH